MVLICFAIAGFKIGRLSLFLCSLFVIIDDLMTMESCVHGFVELNWADSDI